MEPATLDMLSSLLAYRRSACCEGWVRLPAGEIRACALPRTGGCTLRHFLLGSLTSSRVRIFDALDSRLYSFFLSHLVDLFICQYTPSGFSLFISFSPSSTLVCRLPLFRQRISELRTVYINDGQLKLRSDVTTLITLWRRTGQAYTWLSRVGFDSQRGRSSHTPSCHSARGRMLCFVPLFHKCSLTDVLQSHSSNTPVWGTSTHAQAPVLPLLAYVMSMNVNTNSLVVY